MLARVQPGVYTEQPARSKAPLDAFLFDTHRGYCQHFSGAMALLLRMGGIPARVAVGFAPGQLDSRSGEYVVRDFDAHSWVEAYFPRHRLGHVRPDAGRGPARATRRPIARVSLQRPARSGDGRPPERPAPRRTGRRRGRPRTVPGADASRRSCSSSRWRVLVALRRRAPRAARPSASAGARRARARAAAQRADGGSRRRRSRDLERRLATTPRRAPTCAPCAARASARAAHRRPRASAARCAASLRRGSAAWGGCAPGGRCRHGRSRRARALAELRPGGARAGARPARRYHFLAMQDAYELFSSGTSLLESGDHHAAVVPLSRARDLEPGKASVREALGRALFGAQRYSEAAEEFRAVVDHAPTNDYALFCLGRSLQLMGRHAEARHPLALAALPAPRARRLPPLPRSVAAPRGVGRAQLVGGRDCSSPSSRSTSSARAALEAGSSPWIQIAPAALAAKRTSTRRRLRCSDRARRRPLRPSDLGLCAEQAAAQRQPDVRAASRRPRRGESPLAVGDASPGRAGGRPDTLRRRLQRADSGTVTVLSSSQASVCAGVARRSFRKWALAHFFCFKEHVNATTLQHQIETRLAQREPEVEVLLAEVVGDHGAALHRPSRRASRWSSASASRSALPEIRETLRARGLLARARAPAHQARALPPLRRPPRAACARATPRDGQQELHR